MARIELERIRDVAAVLGGKRALGAEISEPDEMRQAVKRGLPFKALEALVKTLGLQTEEDVAGVTGMAVRTLARRKVSRTLTRDESDRVYRVARVTARAVDVLGSPQRAESWLKKPNTALGNEVPLTILDTDVGAHQVESILGRIEHGVPS